MNDVEQRRLEDLDLLVDCTQQRLVPRDPRFVINELG
jgi:hypothetical protein